MNEFSLLFTVYRLLFTVFPKILDVRLLGHIQRILQPTEKSNCKSAKFFDTNRPSDSNIILSEKSSA